jgi:hypothetical protein
MKASLHLGGYGYHDCSLAGRGKMLYNPHQARVFNNALSAPLIVFVRNFDPWHGKVFAALTTSFSAAC